MAVRLPVMRGAALGSLVTVGTDAATLVSLLQAPDAIKEFALWVRSRSVKNEESIKLSAKSGDRRILLKVDGRIEADVIAEFTRSFLTVSGSRE